MNSKINILNSIIKAANLLDDLGMHSQADKLDSCAEKAKNKHHSESYMFKPEVSSSIKRLQKILSELEEKGERELPDWMESYMATINDRVTSIHDAFFERY